MEKRPFCDINLDGTIISKGRKQPTNNAMTLYTEGQEVDLELISFYAPGRKQNGNLS